MRVLHPHLPKIWICLDVLLYFVYYFASLYCNPYNKEHTCHVIIKIVVILITTCSSEASYLVLGGGGQDPLMYRQKKTYMREGAKRASATETYTVSCLKILVISAYNSVPFYFIMVWRYKQHYLD